MAFDEQKQRENSELRKKRRKKEQIQAFAVLLGALLVVVVVLVAVVSGVNAILGSGSKDKKAKTVEKEIEESEVADSKEEEASQQDGESSDETESVSSSEIEDTEETDSGENSQTEEEVVPEEMTEEMKAAHEAEILDSYVQNIMSTLTLEEKIGQMFLVTPENITGVNDTKQAGSTISAAINDYAVGGFLFDEGNMEDKDQLSLMIKNIRSFSKLEMFFAVSDEGGEDSPLSLGGIRENPLLSQSEIAVGGASEAYSAGISKSSEFRNLGINLNLAPMADVSTNDKSYIASRSFGNTANGVLSLAKSELKGMTDQGVACCVKYFPGHGDVTGNTQTARVISQRTKEQLDATEGVIYKELIEEGVPMIMVSHVTMTKISEENIPASLSSEIVTDILRTEWGFEGVIVTDYMNKNAITRFYKHADASVMAVQAGVDMIAVPGDFKKSYNGLLKAVEDGEITEERINESVERILKMKYKNVLNYASEDATNSMDAGVTETIGTTDNVDTAQTTDTTQSTADTAEETENAE